VKVSFVAGFGPIVRDIDASHDFWANGINIEFSEVSPGYFATDDLEGVKHFGLWPLSEAAENTFGTPDWPADVPVPNAGIEFDVESPEAVGEAVAELRAKGYRILRDVRLEDWQQTTARLLSPEGLLVGISFTPWMHPTHDATTNDPTTHDPSDDTPP
jgi:catechol 2,3-dioxygenase-like lactoylglutathione lyase family enzyme